jgi:hypothetical protein
MDTRKSALALACALVAACANDPGVQAPQKQVSPSRGEAAVKADALFWQTFHGGKYEDIPAALNALTGAYLADPNDDVTAAHVAWLHIWRVGESARLDRVAPTVTDDAILARRYFQEAVDLNPHEARYLGFLASATLAESSIHRDARLKLRGEALMRQAIDAWPEFNLFTAGYVASGNPVSSAEFRQGLEWQWQDVDVCVNEKVDRANPDFSRYMALATTEGPKRACWNTWIAPHNFEGFFLNMGDMLVKAGEWQKAQIVYANAKLSPTYGQWKFRDVLERRVTDAQANVEVFNGTRRPDSRRGLMMLGSPFACMACHQE